MNAFEIFDLSVRPHINQPLLKERFLSLSSACHPDRIPSQSEDERQKATHQFAEINQAYRILSQSRDRLQLVLEIERGEKPKDIQKIPPGTMDLFVEIGQACRDFDLFYASSQTPPTSSILKACLMRQSREWTSRLESLLQKVDELRLKSETEIQSLDQNWDQLQKRKDLLERIETLARLLSYVERWRGQLEERKLNLIKDI